MKKIIVGVLGMFALAACDNADMPTAKPIYTCGNYDVEINIADDGNVLHAVISGDAVDLGLAVSASGARYTGVLNDTPIVLWNKGDLWTMFVGSEEIMIDCVIK